MMQANDSDSFASRTRNDTPLNNGALPLRPGIHEAVNNAVEKSDTGVDPNLVAEITEQVLDALKAKGVAGAGAPNASTIGPTQQPTPASSQTLPPRTTSSTTPQQSFQYGSQIGSTDNHTTPLHQPAPTTARHHIPASPTSPASSQIPPRYTPPSPNRYETSSHGSSSPEPQYSEAGSYSKGSRRDSKSSMSGQEDMATSRQRQRPVRIPSSVEETSLEKAWKPLFDNGKATERLGQLLRGLAKHLIEDSNPKNSIVVTPGKLADFFEATKMKEEMYPWVQVFGGQLTNQSISRIFLQLRCQHHLVQFKPHDTPTIPGLTPEGFATFMVMVIKAYPDLEFQRMDKAVRNMPISNADNPSERFPKQLTRRLFPASGDTQSQQRLTAALSSENVGLNHSNPLPPPPPTQPPSASAHSSFSERERNPYASAAFSSAIDDDDLRATSSSFPIERERKPYRAREGSGKIHEEPRIIPNGIKIESGARPIRANSALPVQPPHFQPTPSRPTDIPNSVPRSHRMSMGAAPNLRYGTSPAHNIHNPYTRSEGTNVADIPASQYASNMDYEDQPHRDPRRSFRRQVTEEDIARGFGVPRGVYDHGTPNGYGHRPQDTYGSYPGHPPPPPQQLPRY